MRGRDEEGEVGDLGEEGEDEDIDKKDTFIDGDNNSNEYQATINTKSNNSRKPLERATQQLQEQILSNQIELTSEAVLKALEMPTPSEILIEGIVSKHMLSFQEQILRSLSKSLEQTMTMKMQQEEKKLIYQLQEILYSVGMMESISPLLSFSATTNSATPSLSTTTTAAPNHSNNSNNSLFNFQAGDALNNNTNNTNNITINASSSSSSIDSQKHLNHVRQELQKKIIEGRK
jgi:6-phosphogluconate dehydrogenase